MHVEFEGQRPVLEASAFVAPGAVLIGRVRLRAQASVWYNATLRGDNEWIEIGERSNVQDNSVVHTDMGAPLVVGADVTIGHSVTLHGCTIEDQALIGMGSTLMNHAVIGTGSILGANSLVPEGKRIPPGVLALGAPAKVVRELKPEEKQLIRASALHYVANADRHRGANVIDDRANT